MTTNKPRLLVLSHVLPFPASSGQRMRVRNTLLAARQRFHVTFVSVVNEPDRESARRQLQDLCDEAILLSRRSTRSATAALWHGVVGRIYAVASGLKPSNYAIGKVDLAAERVSQLLEKHRFDCALIEYWHGLPAAQVLRRRGIPCVLDMHDILWRSYARELEGRRGVPRVVRRWAVERYRRREESAWRCFDGVTAINEEEFQYVRRQPLGEAVRVFCAPMGVSLEDWAYRWAPSRPSRIAFYGGLAGAQNQEGARRCAKAILPMIWRRFPETELWIVGSEPPEWLQRLASDPRIHITGFVQDVAPLLATMTAVLCPWTGTFGFRSRLIEAMAVGAPVVASRDAVAGMGISDGQSVLLADTDKAFAEASLRLLERPALALAQSRAGRECAERSFGLDQTYGRWLQELLDWLPEREKLAS